MNPKIPFIFLIMILTIMLYNDFFNQWNFRIDHDQYQRHVIAFTDSVTDIGQHMGELEAQQTTDDVRYDKAKKLELDLDLINSYYESVVIKLGIAGDDYSLDTIKMHVPTMVFVEYDGFRMASPKISSGEIGVNISQLHSYSWNVSPDMIVYFNLDDSVVFYMLPSRRYVEGTLESIFPVVNGYGVESLEEFKRIKQDTIVKRIEAAMESEIASYNNDLAVAGFELRFSLPSGLSDHRFSDVGFLAYVQGYPLPGGERYTGFSFGSSRISRGKEFYGVIRSDGKHLAYETACGVPSNSVLIETLYGGKEAARKGYFVESCPY